MAWGWNSDEEPEQSNISRKARVGGREGDPKLRQGSYPRKGEENGNH